MLIPDYVSFLAKIDSREARIGIIGLGYVGLPLTLACIRKKFRVIGFDTDRTKVAKLMRGESYIKHIDSTGIVEALQTKRFFATYNFKHSQECDVLVICVPTPLNRNREPDMQYIESTAQLISPVAKGQLIVLESTTYPGTTDTLLKGILERDGRNAGHQFALAFSPEREDPGNAKFETRTIPKLVGADDISSRKMATHFYKAVLDNVVPVSSTRVAEMAKLLENIYRSVNIALVNEIKTVCDAMGINVWEVIDAAATKPFGFMPFYPGPGLGGHCIPIDPFYLTWKAREYGMTTKFIELAGEINTGMPHYVYDRVVKALNYQEKAVRGSYILVLGVAYKPNVDDMRESPAFPLIDMLLEAGAFVRYHDPHIPKLPPMRHYSFDHPNFQSESVPLQVDDYDAVVIITNHDGINYEEVAGQAQLVVDCRNALKGLDAPNIFRA